MITDEKIKQGMEKAYKQAGHNAYFSNGFEAGVKFAEKQVKNITYEPVLAVVNCDWRLVDNGMMGFHDYEYKTTCGRTLDKDTTTNANYCPYCGGKRNNR